MKHKIGIVKNTFRLAHGKRKDFCRRGNVLNVHTVNVRLVAM